MAKPKADELERLLNAGLTPRLVDAGQAAAMCGLGRTQWDRLVAEGTAPQPIRHLGDVVLWPVAELDRWIAEGCRPVARAEAEAKAVEGLRAGGRGRRSRFTGPPTEVQA